MLFLKMIIIIIDLIKILHFFLVNPVNMLIEFMQGLKSASTLFSGSGSWWGDGEIDAELQGSGS